MGTIGVSFLYATGVIYFVELGLALLGVPWSVWSVSIPALLIAIFAGRIAGATQRPRLQWPRLTLVDALTVIAIVAYAVYATLAPVWEWDFWAIWGLKGRVFYEARSIDWRFLGSRWNDFAHPDYPLLLPLNYAYAALLGGGWSDRWLGLITVAFAPAFLLIVRDLVARETTPLIASTITFAATAFALSGFIGLAEAPLIAFAGAASLFLRRAVLDDDAAAMTHGALLAGLAACTKNEGMALLVAIAAALALSKVRLVWRFWPAVAVALPWVIVRALHRFPTDLVQGSFTARMLSRMSHLGAVGAMLLRNLPLPWVWIAMLAALLVVPHAFRGRERFVLLAVVFQLAIDVVAYLSTPFSVAWQVETSWLRVAAQLAAPLLVVVMLMLARTFAPEHDLAHAEARSDH
jgi:hypothetical protein